MLSFEVIQTQFVLGRSLVFARRIGEGEFRLGLDSALGGVRVTTFLEIPRRVNVDGTPDHEVFAFELVDGTEADRLRVGARVSLTGVQAV